MFIFLLAKNIILGIRTDLICMPLISVELCLIFIDLYCFLFIEQNFILIQFHFHFHRSFHFYHNPEIWNEIFDFHCSKFSDLCGSNTEVNNGFSETSSSCDSTGLIPDNVSLSDVKFRVCGSDIVQVGFQNFKIFKIITFRIFTNF